MDNPAPTLEELQAEVNWYKQREADICKAVGGVSDGGRYRNDVIEHLQMLYTEHKLMKDHIKAFMVEGEQAERSAIMQGTNSPFLPGFLVVARRLFARIHL